MKSRQRRSFSAEMKARVALEAFEEGQNGGCSGSSELAIVVPRRSWREVFRWKTEERREERKK
jgi:hypothetical protein